MIWAIENPERGIVETEDMDHVRVMAVVRPYLGEMRAELTKWRPNENIDMHSSAPTDARLRDFLIDQSQS